MKEFLDSVHGHIRVPKEWCREILDTPQFQRLRRIEQNSCRSVYPSARHDRFIHSLGVYHIGTIIAEHLAHTTAQEYLPEDCDKIFLTYRLACLLHDVGHTPFSHTFETFYDEQSMKDALIEVLGDEDFRSDIGAHNDKLTEHELLSAYVAVMVYRPLIGGDNIDWPLLVRMIIGMPYIDDNDQPLDDSFSNVMISLIHGSIDADNLDYVCRDSWAGGYNNFAVDLRRLIGAIRIVKSDNRYELAFSSKALNEIEAVLNIKNFQFLYVLNHHKVHLEQHYLIEGIKTAAVYHTGIADRDQAIAELCDFHAYLDPKSLAASGYRLHRPCDDDFVAMMKLSEPDEYITGWFSRSFQHTPLWKSKIEFFNTFADELFHIPVPIYEQNKNRSDEYLKRKRLEYIETICNLPCKEYVARELGLDKKGIIIKKIMPKVRRLNPDEIMVWIGGDVKKFTDLVHDSFSLSSEMYPFSYWYVNLCNIEGNDIAAKKATVINKIKEFIRTIA